MSTLRDHLGVGREFILGMGGGASEVFTIRSTLFFRERFGRGEDGWIIGVIVNSS
jgi:hypothetical protein